MNRSVYSSVGMTTAEAEASFINTVRQVPTGPCAYANAPLVAGRVGTSATDVMPFNGSVKGSHDVTSSLVNGVTAAYFVGSRNVPYVPRLETLPIHNGLKERLNGDPANLASRQVIDTFGGTQAGWDRPFTSSSMYQVMAAHREYGQVRLFQRLLLHHAHLRAAEEGGAGVFVPPLLIELAAVRSHGVTMPGGLAIANDRELLHFMCDADEDDCAVLHLGTAGNITQAELNYLAAVLGSTTLWGPTWGGGVLAGLFPAPAGVQVGRFSNLCIYTHGRDLHLGPGVVPVQMSAAAFASLMDRIASWTAGSNAITQAALSVLPSIGLYPAIVTPHNAGGALVPAGGLPLVRSAIGATLPLRHAMNAGWAIAFMMAFDLPHPIIQPSAIMTTGPGCGFAAYVHLWSGYASLIFGSVTSQLGLSAHAFSHQLGGVYGSAHAHLFLETQQASYVADSRGDEPANLRQHCSAYAQQRYGPGAARLFDLLVSDGSLTDPPRRWLACMSVRSAPFVVWPEEFAGLIQTDEWHTYPSSAVLSRALELLQTTINGAQVYIKHDHPEGACCVAEDSSGDYDSYSAPDLSFALGLMASEAVSAGVASVAAGGMANAAVTYRARTYQHEFHSPGVQPRDPRSAGMVGETAHNVVRSPMGWSILNLFLCYHVGHAHHRQYYIAPADRKSVV